MRYGRYERQLALEGDPVMSLMTRFWKWRFLLLGCVWVNEAREMRIMKISSGFD